jgi:voltage-gated potassium channel
VSSSTRRRVPEELREVLKDRSAERKARALQKFEEVTAWPMLVLALAIVPLILIPLLFDISETTEATFIALDWFIWGVFAAEYGIRLYLAPKKWAFVRHHVIDLVVVLLPFLRPLRVVRSARVLRIFRAARSVAFLLRALRAGRRVLTRHRLHYALLVTGVVVVAGGLLVESFERSAAEANIKSLQDAIWWAITTVTTVGYGDRFPTTAAGRGVGVTLMIVGIALFGFLAGSLASYFLESRDEEQEEDKDRILEEMLERLERIELALERSVASDGHPVPSPSYETSISKPS